MNTPKSPHSYHIGQLIFVRALKEKEEMVNKVIITGIEELEGNVSRLLSISPVFRRYAVRIEGINIQTNNKVYYVFVEGDRIYNVSIGEPEWV